MLGTKFRTSAQYRCHGEHVTENRDTFDALMAIHAACIRSSNCDIVEKQNHESRHLGLGHATHAGPHGDLVVAQRKMHCESFHS